MSRYLNAAVLVSFVVLLSQAYGQRYLRSVDALNDINRESWGSEEAERLRRQVDPLNAINIGVNAVDNSRHGQGGGRGSSGAGGPVGGRHGGEEASPEVPETDAAERLKRQAPRLADINVNVNATDNSKHGGSGRGHHGGKGGHGGPSHPGPVDPAHPEPAGPAQPPPHGEPYADDGAGHDGPAAPGHPDDHAGGDHGGQSQTQSQSQSGAGSQEQSQSQSQRRHRRQAPRLDDTNINVMLSTTPTAVPVVNLKARKPSV